jgi:NADH:ubiquinone oxidoreductase subunit B-like Fe-S oxidoreductase
MPEPKVVVAMGACAHGGGIFRDFYNVENGVNNIIPVDVWIPGCAPRVEALIDGIVEAIKIWEKKGKEKEFMRNHDEVVPKLGVEDDD